MSAIPLPKTENYISPSWSHTPPSRAPSVEAQSSSGKISYDRWNAIQKERAKTITTPPDDVRLQRELDDILEECAVKDWNGYDAKPIDRDSVGFVCEFLKHLPDDISYPELCAEPNGDLTMIWRKNDYHLVVGIDSSGMIAWGGTSPKGGHLCGAIKFNNNVPEDVISILHSVDKSR